MSAVRVTPTQIDAQYYLYAPALELAAMIRGREASSREVVQPHLDRVETVNPHVNAIVRLLPEQALATADGKYTELRCLAIAEAIEQRLGPLTPIDPVAG